MKALDSRHRGEILQSLRARQFDVVVIGGGVTGCGVAVDAASRGLAVALVESGDLASGTSSRSGQLFHGGLRSLGRFDLGQVREALLERDLMVDKLCPHLVRPEPFVVPLERPWDRTYLGAGAAMYDLLRATGHRGSIPWHRHLSKRSTLVEMPALRPEMVRGGVRYCDVRVDDARHTMTLGRTAASLGATVATRTRVVDFIRSAGRVGGIRVRDTETGEEFDISARVVINAAGVWADRLQRLAGGHQVGVNVEKGVHLVVAGDRMDSRAGLVVRAGDGLAVVRKWFGHWLIGSTELPWSLDDGQPSVASDDIELILGHVNRWLRSPLQRGDILGAYAGLRPILPGVGTPATYHGDAVLEDPIGLVMATGGTYTTYRVLARKAVDLAAVRLRRAVPASSTEQLALVGASGFAILKSMRTELCRGFPLSGRWIDHLLGRYGSLATDLLDLIDARPALGQPLVGAPGYLAAEVVYATLAEGALHVSDVLVRRTRASIELRDAGMAAAPQVARLMGEVLGWSDDRCEAEVEAYAAVVSSERGAVLR